MNEIAAEMAVVPVTRRDIALGRSRETGAGVFKLRNIVSLSSIFLDPRFHGDDKKGGG